MKTKLHKAVQAPLAAAIVAALCAGTALAAGPSAMPPMKQQVRPMATLSGANDVAGNDRFIVKYRTSSTARAARVDVAGNVRAAATRAGVRADSRSALGAEHIRRLSTGAEVVRVSRKLDRVESARLVDQLRADPSVEYVQEDFLKHAMDFVPDDTYFEELQWDFQNTSVGIHAPTAWDTSTGEGVVVAVLDTGYVDHRDLDANIIPGYDFINDPAVAGDGDGRDADAHDPGDFTAKDISSWHGTHVAGTVAAVTNNGFGLAGIAFNAKVQPVRVLGRGGGYTSDIADAITWASGGSVDGVPDNPTPAEVINLSLGGERKCNQDPVTQAAIDGAISRGVTVVVAAGNDNMDATNFSPASCEGVITVGASGSDGARSYFSNYGAPVTLSAPGGNATSGTDPENRWIWSLGNSSEAEPVPSPEGDAILGMIGTSQAAPHVAATVALMQAAAVSAGLDPLTPAQVKNVLRASVSPFTVAPPSNKPQGPGILNAALAVANATEVLPSEDATPLPNRVPETGLMGAAGDGTLYQLTVPAGTRSLNLRTYGGSGDVSIYVAYDRPASEADHDRKSARPGNNEAVVITNPAAGNYFVRVVGETAFSNVTLLGLY
ncbi:S8 family serine peptidase [Lysobacter sp. SG-8]|uniref:S8 family serine peptidase n=1 Tax=Marilutibacter penaei TaxID=2759900 RepID=A0A7W3YDX0_9GAMM|nr:S8 family peptidase [Lysobacter penaei]MBB1088184.1 S8 family serine peptidase [Lysobacter penaei]